MSTSNSFPSHNIDPKKKGLEWCRQMVKAMASDAEGHPNMFYHYREKYRRIKKYAMGRQDREQYRPSMHIDEQSDSRFISMNEAILAIPKKFRSLALGKLQKSEYNIVATPIDALAKDEADSYFADIKAKLLVRNELMKQNPELAESPLLQPDASEPMDLEELEMQMEYGFKHSMAIEAELGIQLIFFQNGITHCRHKIFEDLFDFGAGIVKDFMEPGGKVGFRKVEVDRFICNYCEYDDFRDMWYAAEYVKIPWNQFVEDTNFTEEEYDKIFESCKRSNKDAYVFNRKHADDKFMVTVLDAEWFSTDITVYENKVNDLGNPIFGKVRPYNKDLPDKEQDKAWQKKVNKLPFKKDLKGYGQYKEKRQNVYKAKWVVGTDFVYEYGLATYMKRDRRNVNKTNLSYHVVAINFHEMSASGIMEDIIPMADAIQTAWLKLQNIRNELVPYVIDIDLDALEDVALSKGGNGGDMTPKDLIQMMFQKKILVNRRRNVSNGGGQYKAIDIITTNLGEAISGAWNDLNMNISLIREATGFNELTDGSTPNPKTLTTPAQMAYEATNNALYQIQYAEKRLLLKLAEAVFCRLRRAIKEGKVEGYIPSLGNNTVKFIAVSPDVDLHDYGIMLEDKPTPEQRAMLQQNLQKGIMEGTLDITDSIVIENTPNLKQAEQLLAYRIKKRKEEAQQNALQMQQANAETQIQSAQAAAQMDMQKLQMQYDLELRNAMEIKKMEMQIKQMELQVKMQMNEQSLASKEKIADAQETQDIETVLPADE